MTENEKITMIKELLSDGGSLPSDEKLGVYLNAAKAEILNWMYSQIGGVPDDVTDVPAKYEITQVYAVVAGYTHAGAEGETVHNENGINRSFTSADMLDYIHKNVYAIVRVGAVVTT
jgi:hypothetical protein